MYWMKRVSALILITVLLATVLVHSAHAQSNPGESITISPTNNAIEAEPGQAVNGSFSIVNDGQVPYTYKIYARPYSIQNDAYDAPHFNPSGAKTDLYKWVRFHQTEFTIKPHETQKIDYSVAVPKGTAGGGYYGVVFAETSPALDGQDAAVKTNKRVGHIVYARVGGRVVESGEPAGMSIPFWQQGTLTASLGVKNTGNVHFTTDTKVTVRGITGALKYQLNKEHLVLPETTRWIKAEWKGAPPIGIYKVTVSQEFLGERQERSSYVLLMPLYVIILVGILIAAALLRAIFRKR